MTDKEQIMIDGVDVSECLFYQSNFEEDYDVKIKHFCSNWHNSCESVNNSNCYFKQLARKTQECEKYKKLAADFKDVNKQLGYKYLTIKKKCEELKEKYEEVKEDRYNLNMEMYTLYRYRKALEEIKAIVKDFNDNRLCFYDDINDCQNCDMNTDCNYLRKFKILDIIRKAKGEE